MINLIPPAGRKAVKREYWFRVISVWCLLAGFAFLVTTLLRIPEYVLVNSQLRAFASSYEAAAGEDLQFRQAEEQIRLANNMSSTLEESHGTVSFSSVLSEIDDLAGGRVTILNYSLERVDGAIGQIAISGDAQTRQSLADFKTALEASASFDTVTLPISNLVKDSDIPFNITITPATEEDHDT